MDRRRNRYFLLLGVSFMASKLAFILLAACVEYTGPEQISHRRECFDSSFTGD